MTDRQIQDLGPAFAKYLRQYRDCLGQSRVARHFDDYCRGLISDLPRKSVEPIALASGTRVRTLQEFLTVTDWELDTALERLQCWLGDRIAELPADPLGNVGVIDETSCRKKGDKTPGVQRQYLGCVGKVDNGIVSVHIGVARGRFQALLDADPFLPESWSGDRERCRAAGIPDSLVHRPKWRIALEQLDRVRGNGIRFDWLTFDEGYGSCPGFLHSLGDRGQKYVAEVPVSMSLSDALGGAARRADGIVGRTLASFGTAYTMRRATTSDVRWRARTHRVWMGTRECLLVAAISEATGEVKYFLTESVDEDVGKILEVAFRRATIEHGFRVAKSEAGLSHFEGRQYVGLMRHTILTLIVLGFVSAHADGLRGEKPARDDGAGVPCDAGAMRVDLPPEAGDVGTTARRGGDPIPPAPKRAGHQIPQEKAA